MESFGGCLKLKNRLLAWISVKSVRDMTLMQPIQPLQVGLDQKINKTKQTFSYPSCNFIALRGAIKLCCCINRWSISCRLPNLSPTPLHRFHRHDIHGIQRCLWRLYICLLLCEKYSGGCGSYDPSILNGVFNVFLPIKATHFVVYFSKEYDVVLVVDPVFHWRDFFFSLGSVICKNYTSPNDKYGKNTNAIDIGITGSWGMGRSGRHRLTCRGRGRRCRPIRRGRG